jgi:predicted dehydrogenase
MAKEGDIRLNYKLGGGAMMDMGCELSQPHTIVVTRSLTHVRLSSAYPLSVMRFLTGSSPITVLTATSTVYPSPSSAEEPVDLGTKATLSFPNDVTATLYADFAMPWWGPFGLLPRMPDISVQVECERGEVKIFNYLAPVIYHWIRVRLKDTSGKGKVTERIEKAYKFEDGGKGEDWWTTYRHQFEAFVDQVKGRTPRTWISEEDSVENLEWIEKIYEKVKLSFAFCFRLVVSDPFQQNGLGSRPKSQA